MYVYDNMGNMVNERAATLGREFGQRTGELLDTFLTEGMPVVEARALLGYI